MKTQILAVMSQIITEDLKYTDIQYSGTKIYGSVNCRVITEKGDNFKIILSHKFNIFTQKVNVDVSIVKNRNKILDKEYAYTLSEIKDDVSILINTLSTIIPLMGIDTIPLIEIEEIANNIIKKGA